MKKTIKIAAVFLFIIPIFSFAQQDTVRLVPRLTNKSLPFGLTAKVPEDLPKISVALSGGGSRAIIELGVLKALEEYNIPIESIYGTSMGSIIGGLYASGYSASQLDSIFTSINWLEFYSAKETYRNELYLDQKITEDVALLSLDIDGLNPLIPTAFNSGQRFQSFLNYYTLNAPVHTYGDFDKLKFKFRAISTDLSTGKMVVISKGSLSQALRASSSVAFLLEPVEIDSLMLVDGGLVANVPTKAAYEGNSDYIIAVNAASGLRRKNDLNTPLKIADQIVSIPMNLVTEYDLKYADVIIAPKLGDRKNDDFSSLDSLIALGYNSTIEKINKIKTDIFQLQLLKNYDKLTFYDNVIPNNSNSEIENRVLGRLKNSKHTSDGEILISLNKEYNSGKFSNVSAQLILDSNKTKLKIDYSVKPNVDEINILGADKANEVEIYNILKPLKGSFYCERNLVKYLLKITTHYRSIGLPFAEIKNIYFDKSSNNLNITIDEGIINQIDIVGNELSRERLIERELVFNEGEHLTSESISKSLQNLRTTGLFNSVDINIVKQDGLNIVRVNIEDKLTGIIRLGLKFDNERFLQPSIDIRNGNLFGTGTELGLNFFGGLRNQLFILEHKANRIFNTYLTYKLKAYYDNENIYTYSNDITTNQNEFSSTRSGEYRQSIWGFSAGLGMQAGKFGSLISEFRYERNKVSNIDGETVVPYILDLAALRFNLKIDTQDKYPYPNHGTLLNTYYETSQKFFGGDESYVKYALQYRGYFTINKVHTIIPRFEIGFADETLPLSQQFRFGGQYSFWGYHEDEFRGRQIIIGSLAYRYKLPFQMWFDTYISALYNIGSIWEREEEMKLKNFKHAIGLMISWDTPIGPADFGLGRSFFFDKGLENIVVKGDPILYFSVGYFF